MDPLYKESIRRSVLGIITFIVILIVPSGSWGYWQGWLFIAVFSMSTSAFTLYLALYDKPLLARRLQAGPWHEKERSQKIIMSLAFVAFLIYVVLPALDYRYQLSPVPAWVTIAADIVVALSFVFLWWVVRTNSFAAANIRVEEGQRVIDTGPYAYVRHPMYAGASFMLFITPLALGSWWSMLLFVPFSPVLLWRLLDEERVLHRELPGYTEYTQRVKYRIFPYIW